MGGGPGTVVYKLRLIGNESSLCVCGLSIEFGKNGSCLCLCVCVRNRVIVRVSE